MLSRPEAVRTGVPLVTLEGGRLLVREFAVDDPRVVRFLQEVPPEERLPTLVRALTIGVLCLERASTQTDVDFLRREMQGMVGEMQKVVGEFGTSLVKQVGTGDGQALAPVRLQVDAAQKVLQERLMEVRRLLAEEMDPARTTSTMGRALKVVQDLLDPQRADSIQGRLATAIQSATGEKGQLAATVKQAVADAMKPLADRVDGLVKEIRKEEAVQQAVAEVVDSTPMKGPVMESRVVETLAAWAAITGAQVQHVGGDNRPGDILLTVPSVSASGREETIVIEVKDQEKRVGRQAIGEALDERMRERGSHAGLWIARDEGGLAKEIGDYAEGAGQNGPWIATVEANLIMAVRHLRVLMRLASLQATRPDLDLAAAQGGIERVRASLKRFRTINTEAGTIHASANSIEQTARTLRGEVEAALFDVEGSLRIPPASRRAPGQAALPADSGDG
ncbi:MAG TPA: hypothetical protein VI796_00110 [Candidatus Thermoplasmatota archaeon]|nr:hypothetical protein [Candidatus Thermoplasmatota archaeon]